MFLRNFRWKWCHMLKKKNSLIALISSSVCQFEHQVVWLLFRIIHELCTCHFMVIEAK